MIRRERKEKREEKKRGTDRREDRKGRFHVCFNERIRNSPNPAIGPATHRDPTLGGSPKTNKTSQNNKLGLDMFLLTGVNLPTCLWVHVDKRPEQLKHLLYHREKGGPSGLAVSSLREAALSTHKPPGVPSGVVATLPDSPETVLDSQMNSQRSRCSSG